jgi:cytochrome c-type biogenesis protein CcmF
MIDYGHLVILLALAIGCYAMVVSLLGASKNRDDLIQSGQRALFSVTALLTVAVVLLWYQILGHDFHNEYVASYTNRAMPTFYTWAALWGGQKGSLLFWGWLLSLFSALVVYLNRD